MAQHGDSEPLAGPPPGAAPPTPGPEWEPRAGDGRWPPPRAAGASAGSQSTAPDAQPPPAPSGEAARGTSFLDVPGTPPATRRDGWAWLLLAVIGFVVGELVALILVTVAAAVAGESSQLTAIEKMASPPEWYVGVSLVGLWVGFFAAPWIASKARGTGRFVADLGIRFRPVDLFGVVIGVGSQILIDIAYAPFIHNSKSFSAPTTKLTGSSHGWGFAVIAVLTVIGAPFFEELFFRGLLFKALARIFAPAGAGPSTRRALAVVAAVVLDGLLFALAHGEWAQFVGLAAFGMVLAAVSYRTARLGMNMVSHASFNLVAVLAVLSSRGVIVH
jgi:uncharacterized protein